MAHCDMPQVALPVFHSSSANQSSFTRYNHTILLEIKDNFPLNSVNSVYGVSTLLFGVFGEILHPAGENGNLQWSRLKRGRWTSILVRLWQHPKTGLQFLPSWWQTSSPLTTNWTNCITASTLRETSEKEVCSVLLWLGPNTTDNNTEPEGFSIYRADCSYAATGNTIGGGACFFINNACCTNVKVVSQSCRQIKNIWR